MPQVLATLRAHIGWLKTAGGNSALVIEVCLGCTEVEKANSNPHRGCLPCLPPFLELLPNQEKNLDRVFGAIGV
jgi:hypothetical protein